MVILEFKMISKEKVKEEIEKMPDDLVEEVYRFINTIKITKIRKRKIHTFHLKGRFDNLNIRKKAYE